MLQLGTKYFCPVIGIITSCRPDIPYDRHKQWWRASKHPKYHQAVDSGDKLIEIYNAYDIEKLTIPHIRRRVFMARPPFMQNHETSKCCTDPMLFDVIE